MSDTTPRSLPAPPKTVSEPQDSVLQEWAEKFFEDWINLAAYWRERRRILDNPAVILETGPNRLRRGPMHFATQGIISLLILLSLLYSGLRLVPIPAIKPPTDFADEARLAERELAVLMYRQETATGAEREAVLEKIATKKRRRFLMTYQRFHFTTLLEIMKLTIGAFILVTGTFLRRKLRPWHDIFPRAALADRIYIYYYGAVSFGMMFLSLALMFFMEGVLEYRWFRPALTALMDGLIHFSTQGSDERVWLALSGLVALLIGPTVGMFLWNHQIARKVARVLGELLNDSVAGETRLSLPDLHKAILSARNTAGLILIPCGIVYWLIAGWFFFLDFGSP